MTYKRIGSIKIQGKTKIIKKSVYMKEGSNCKYIKNKDRMMKLSKYKKMKSKQTGGNPPTSPLNGGGKKRTKCKKSGKTGKRKCKK